jgi:serine/threonine protein kinase
MSTTSSSSKPTSGWQPPTLEEMQAMLPQYQFVSLLGRGGMGAVYKALQVSLDRLVAIKVLPGDLIDDDNDANFLERFKNEARTMAKMNHPSIVDVFDFGETQTGLLYFVMEFIDGTDVAQMIASQGKLPEDYALSITAHVCDALNYAHKNGVIHRDIKPANILINMDGAVKVADFGLAKASDAGQSGITKTNMAMGTPDFVAPEALIPGIPLDGRADLYAIGVMLYQMLTGEIPRGIWSLPGTKIGTDPRFDAIITKAMQTDREVRYQSAADLRRDLDTILTIPRAALIAQQQAAAEAAARATQAQRQQAATPHPQPASTPKKKSSALGPVLGIAASVILVAGLYVMLTGDGSKKPVPKNDTSMNAGSSPASTTPAPSAPSQTQPSPAAPTADSSRFAGVEFPRDLCLPGSTAWRFEGGDLVCADTESGKYAAFVIPQEVRNGFECEVEFSMSPSMAKIAYLKVMFSTPKGWSSMQVFPNNVVTFVNGRQQRPVPLNDNARHALKLAYGADARLVILVDGVQHFDTRDEGSPDIPAWSGVKPGFVNIGAETKGGPPFKIHSIRVTPLDDSPPAAPPVAMTVPAPTPPVPAPVASTAPAMPAAVPAATSPASIAPPATNTTNIAGPPKLETMPLPGITDSLVVACSADGTRLIVADTVANGAIHLSKDSGATWTTASATGRWSAVASSADGTKLVAAIDAGSIYTSTDSGVTWTERPSGAGPWSSLACSADGTRIVAVKLEASRPIHLSSDFGATWTEKDAGGGFWSGAASSADGTKLVAVGNGWAEGSYIFVSRDSGETWSKRMTDRLRRWSSVASSADGSRLVAVDAGFGAGGQIYTSADSGESWTPRESNRVWSAVTISTDGQKLAATVGSHLPPEVSGAHIDAIYTSQDFGETWQPREMPRNWMSLAASTDGALLVAAAIAENRSGQVFTLDSRTAASKAGNDPRIAQLEKGFKGRLETDADQPFCAALARLNQGYLTAGIPKARAAVQTRGSLFEVTMLDAEKTLIEKGGAVPAEDSAETPASLKTLRATYRGAFAKITAERDAKAAPLYDLYLKAIDAYVAELTKAGKTDTAVRIQALRDEIAAQKPATAAVAASTPATPKTTLTPAPKASPGGGSSWRTAADYLVNNGGTFVAFKNGGIATVTKAAEIPPGRFDIHELVFERLNSVLPPAKDADFAAFNGLRDLRRVHFRPMHNGLSDAAFAFLANNSELINLNFEGANALTDEVLTHIAGLKKLDFLAIQYAENFTGKGLDKIAGAASITNLEFLASGITDEGLKAISTFKKLQAIRFTSTKVTTAGFAALANLKTLVTLTLNGTSFDDEGASAIAGIPNLGNLDISATKITDTGLAKLKSLKKLTSLNLGGTAVTLEAAAEFQKTMPQCRVNR